MSKDKITIELTSQQADHVLGHIRAVETVAVGKHALLYSDVEEEVLLAWARSPLGKLQTKLSTKVQKQVEHIVDTYTALPKQLVDPEQQSRKPEEPPLVHPFCPKPDKHGLSLLPGHYVEINWDNGNTLYGVVTISKVQRTKCDDGTLASSLVVTLEDGVKVVNPASRNITKLAKAYVLADRANSKNLYAGPYPALEGARKQQGKNHGDAILEVTDKGQKLLARWHGKNGKWVKVKAKAGKA